MDKKLFGKFNIIDIILFAIIIIALIAAVVRIVWNNAGDYEDAEITATFITEKVRGEVYKELYVGMELTSQSDDSVLGEVVRVDVRGDNTLAVTVFSEGAKLNHGVEIGGTTYYIGSEVSIIAGDAVFDAYLSEFEANIK